LLLKIQSLFYGVRVLTKKSTTESVIYSVQSLKELNDVIVPQFDNYPPLGLTKKRADFILFKEVLELMNTREHHTMEGLAKIVNIKASMNKGLSEQLKEQFLDVVPVQRPIVEISQFHVSNPS
jgi:LAGLIDADG endonuclease